MLLRKYNYILLWWCVVGLSCIYFVLKYNKSKTHEFESYYLPTVNYDEYNCGCARQGPPIRKSENSSLCSDWSTSRGINQSIIAYTLYGDQKDKNIRKRFYNEMEVRIKEANFFYPGWIVRLYHNFTHDDELANKFICKLYCKHPSFDPCQVDNINLPQSWITGFDPQNIFAISHVKKKSNSFLDFVSSLLLSSLTDKSEIAKKLSSIKRGEIRFGQLLIGKMWRFLPLADSLVGLFLVRDVDSYILPREAAAVEQWLNSYPSLIHGMRDHPSHNGFILAGMWGAMRWIDEEKLSSFLKLMVMEPLMDYWDFDQNMLRRIVWPKVLDQMVIHDSYHCINSFLTPKEVVVLPFPTKRNGTMFISWGPTRSQMERNILKPCPEKCRPKEHQDWKYC